MAPDYTAIATNGMTFPLWSSNFGVADPWAPRETEEERRTRFDFERRAASISCGVPPCALDIATLAKPIVMKPRARTRMHRNARPLRAARRPRRRRVAKDPR